MSKKKGITFLLLLTMILSLAISASAAEMTEARVPVTLTVVNTVSPISCTVPAALPVSLVDGYVVTANNAAITNTGKSGSIRVTKVDVQAGTFEIGIIIARLRSKTARILHSIKNLFRLRRLLHRRIPYNPPPKRWRAHSHKPRLLAPASSRTPRAKLLCRPAPDVHRATWQRRRTMQRPRQQKPRPVRRIVPQELRSLSWAARARRTRSRSRPYIPSRNPIRAAVRQCRITVGLF